MAKKTVTIPPNEIESNLKLEKGSSIENVVDQNGEKNYEPSGIKREVRSHKLFEKYES